MHSAALVLSRHRVHVLHPVVFSPLFGFEAAKNLPRQGKKGPDVDREWINFHLISLIRNRSDRLWSKVRAPAEQRWGINRSVIHFPRPFLLRCRFAGRLLDRVPAVSGRRRCSTPDKVSVWRTGRQTENYSLILLWLGAPCSLVVLLLKHWWVNTSFFCYYVSVKELIFFIICTKCLE